MSSSGEFSTLSSGEATGTGEDSLPSSREATAEAAGSGGSFVPLREFLDRFSLPRVVRVEGGGGRPILLYKQQQRSLRVTATLLMQRYRHDVKVGPEIVIPEGYPVELTRHTWHRGKRNRSRTSGSRKSPRSLRRNRRSALLSRERQCNNSFRISNGKNGWLITANKGCQTTGSSTSFVVGATKFKDRDGNHREIVADYRSSGFIRSAESIGSSKRSREDSNVNSGPERRSDSKISAVSSVAAGFAKCHENSTPRSKTGPSLSDSVLAIPKYDRRTALILRQRKQRQDPQHSQRQAVLLRCRELISNHRVLAVGNEVDQIWTRKRSARTAVQTISASPDKKKRLEVEKNPVELLWKTAISGTIKSGDEFEIRRSVSKKSPQFPQVHEASRCMSATKIADPPQNHNGELIPVSDKVIDRNFPDENYEEKEITNEELPVFETQLSRSISPGSLVEESSLVDVDLSTNVDKKSAEELPIFYPHLPSEESSRENSVEEASNFRMNLSRKESEESVEIIEVRKNPATSQRLEHPWRNRILARSLRNRDACTEEHLNDLTIISMKKERGNIIVVADHKESDSRAGGLSRERKARNPMNLDNDDEDYHFLMSLYHQLRKMPDAKKLKMRLRIQTMFCDETESDSGSSSRSSKERNAS